MSIKKKLFLNKNIFFAGCLRPWLQRPELADVGTSGHTELVVGGWRRALEGEYK